MTVKELRFNGNQMEEIEVDTTNLLCYEFVNDAGEVFQVRFSKEGHLEVATVKHLLYVMPRAANTIHVYSSRNEPK